VGTPNLVFIHVDQLYHGALQCEGNPRVRTPHLDALRAQGMRFTSSFSTNPVCCPARTSWYTGRMSRETGVLDNGYPLQKDIPDLGQWLGGRGIECVYAGKWHVPHREVQRSFRLLHPGFGVGELADAQVARVAEAYLQDRSPAAGPFFLNVGLLNPHDICFWSHARNPAKYEAAADVAGQIPPMPAVYDPSLPMPLGPEQLGYYRYSYDRMVEMVDREVGRVVRAVRQSPHRENTYLIFSSDHGQMNGEHNHYTKGMPWEEAIRVPLFIVGPGIAPGSTSDHLVSGVDLAATILDLFEAPAMPDMNYARSLRPILHGPPVAWRPWNVTECLIHEVMTVVRTATHKSVHQRRGVALYDLAKDAHESRDLASETAYAGILAEHRRHLAEYLAMIKPCPEPEEGWGKFGKNLEKEE